MPFVATLVDWLHAFGWKRAVLTKTPKQVLTKVNRKKLFYEYGIMNKITEVQETLHAFRLQCYCGPVTLILLNSMRLYGSTSTGFVILCDLIM